ncbi:MAG: vitamin K epoxide reductase family protein [Polyangiales bacterium]
MKLRWPTALVLVAALLGAVFAAVSTADFVAHLDRQVHGLHCSFLPGVEAAEENSESGCHVALMSPYSSFWRNGVWGGVPIALPGLALFGFILFWALNLWLGGRQSDPCATGFLCLSTAVPVLTSVVMGYLAWRELGAACKLCIGIYVASLLAFVGALVLYRQAKRAAHIQNATIEPATDPAADAAARGPLRRPAPMHRQALLIAAGVAGLFIALPVLAYALAAPDHSRYVGSCGDLARPGDPHKVLLPLGAQTGGVPAVEVLDPLCPACRGFEQRLLASGLADKLQRQALLFPLDTACNWMVSQSIHPGACAISEALLCAQGERAAVLDWAFAEQSRILEAARQDPKAAARLVKSRFPALASCVGSATVRAKLNRALRWAVANQMPVVTPQLYVGGKKVCDADTDLGLDFVLSRLLEGRP